MNLHAFTGRVFYALVATWVVAIVLGGVFGLPYVGRSYRGVTLPIYSGVFAGVMTACNLASGAIWRGRARRIERDQEPLSYWIAIGVLAAIAAALLIVGIRNWVQLPQ